MVNAEDLSNLVADARQSDPAPVAPAAPAPAYQAPAPAVPESSGPPVALIAGILGVVALIVAIGLVVMLANG